VQFGIELAPWGELADPNALAELARQAEEVGWDGFFVWDAMYHDPDHIPKADPWIAMAAVAAATERMMIGPMVTPVPRRRPWKLAREAVSLDQLSKGRLILGVGLGDPSDEEFEWFGEPGIDHKTRARMLDEGLAIIDGLWSGEPFGFDGEFYHLHEVAFEPRPVQQPRIPIWIGGWWPNKPPFRRAARWDGVHPGRLDRRLSPEDIRDLVAFIRQERGRDDHFDVAVGGSTPGDRPEEAAEIARTYAEAGATWWLEVGGGNGDAASVDQVKERVLQGPPRI
jgi:alkanesulfonate monooxygenase SsuD/methylene tetrahydromethanopterin reductase-like flavin-dependent oxidoreductase (luciferase family)